jgi:NADH-quinone oxidoreductase subunit J
MSAINILFCFFILTAMLGAIAILFSRNVFKSALYLLVTLLSIASLYVLSYAEFLAVAQILVYAGGITVIIIFGIMLTTRISGQPLVVRNRHVLSAGLASILLFVLLVKNLSIFAPLSDKMPPQHIRETGLQIFTIYSLPFEVAGLLLLIALIGAAVVTSQLKSRV